MGLKLPEKRSAGAPVDRQPGVERPRAQPHSCPEPPVLLAEEARPGTNTGCDRRPQEVRDPLPLRPLLQSMQSTQSVADTCLVRLGVSALPDPLPCPAVPLPPSTPHLRASTGHQGSAPLVFPLPRTPLRTPPSRAFPPPPGPHPRCRCLSERLSWTLTLALALLAVLGRPHPQALMPL